MRGVRCCADGAGEGDLHGDVAADVGSRKREFGFCAVPEFGAGDVDALLDTGDGVAVYVV